MQTQVSYKMRRNKTGKSRLDDTKYSQQVERDPKAKAMLIRDYFREYRALLVKAFTWL